MNGVSKPFYVPASESDLKAQSKRIERLVDFGHKNGFISDSDARAMQPTGRPGRLYGLPKVHKGIKEGKKIPPLRPIISNSRANTEAISQFCDHYAKSLVKDVPSYLEDTPDFLRTLQQENAQGPQPPGTFPVTVDVTSLHKY